MDEMEDFESDEKKVTIQFKGEDGTSLGDPLDVPVNIGKSQLEVLVNQLLLDTEAADGPVPVKFSIANHQLSIESSLVAALDLVDEKRRSALTERVLDVCYLPQALFRVRPVTRCTSSMPGHAEAITCVAFSPTGAYLASGSGDKNVRLWDVNTETPKHTCEGHRHWVLVMAWSPSGKLLASACKNGEIFLWDPETGAAASRGPLKGHKNWIGSLAWQPLHLNGQESCLASGSKDGDIRIWNTVLFQCTRVLAGHTAGITCIRWSGENLIYSASQDRTIKVWRPHDGILCRTLEGHGHWVNTMALNTDYVMRIGAFEPKNAQIVPAANKDSPEKLAKLALEIYKSVPGPERMVSGSDDFTLYLWEPATAKKPISRMTGHQQLVNMVTFSPDGRLIASASFDKSVKVWCGKTGKYLASLRGHVQAVYQVAWSADSRLLVSGSADSTLKLFDMGNMKMVVDLPGHADEVYAVDWSPDGQRVASGGKDKVVRIWRK